MNYEIGDTVIFYYSNCEKALEVESRGFIKKINKKSYVIIGLKIMEEEGKIVKEYYEKGVKKELVKEKEKECEARKLHALPLCRWQERHDPEGASIAVQCYRGAHRGASHPEITKSNNIQ